MATTKTAARPDVPMDAELRHPLTRLRGTIRRYVTLEGLATVGLFLAAWFWIGLALDWGLFKISGFDWVMDAPKGIRTTVLVLLLTLLAAVLVTKILVRVLREFSHRALALVLEKRFPHILGDRLITAVELADPAKSEKYGYSKAMVRQTVEDARTRVEEVSVGKAFNWRRLRLQGLTFLVMTVGLLAATGLAALRHLAE